MTHKNYTILTSTGTPPKDQYRVSRGTNGGIEISVGGGNHPVVVLDYDAAKRLGKFIARDMWRDDRPKVQYTSETPQ